jgi:hypothetical protein
VLRTDFSFLVIARYPENDGAYLFYCDEAWSVVTDTLHDGERAAAAQARWEFDCMEFEPAPEMARGPRAAEPS